MYKISPFTPLFFRPTTDKFGARSKYVQTFAPSDRILLQVIRVYEGSDIMPVPPSLFIRDILKDRQTFHGWRSFSINATTTLLWATIQGLEPGIYTVRFGGDESEPFCVTDDVGILEQTTLLQYSMDDNRQRTDTVFVVDGMRQFFDFRIPGGFKDDGWTFGVDNEQFTTSAYDVVDVYSHDMTYKTLTLGNAQGCPVWFAELLNRLLSCTYVYVDGVRYTRYESSVPEMTQELEHLRSYIFKQTLSRVTHLVPNIEGQNQLCIRRVNDKYRSIPDGEESVYQRKIQ